VTQLRFRYFVLKPAMKEAVTNETMKSNTTSKPVPLSRALFTLLLGATGICAMPASARGGQIFVMNSGNGTIGEYTTSGATVNASLITGFYPVGAAVSGGDLFVTKFISGTIGEYTTSGATLNASLITGLTSPDDICVLGGNLFVASQGDNSIGEYTTSGATVNASLVTGLSSANYPNIVRGIVASGGNLFVDLGGPTNPPGWIGEYTTSGATVNASLITGLESPRRIAV
jgi:hypothetical protein